MEFIREVNGHCLILVVDEYIKKKQKICLLLEEYFEGELGQVDTLIPIHDKWKSFLKEKTSKWLFKITNINY